jgi:xanthine dehydrogenase YagT iron-sulfur-binding subunit
VSGSGENERTDRIGREAARLRRQAAAAARAVAATEDQVAETFERVAEHRPDPDASRLRAKAEEARRFAAKERDLSREYNERADHEEHRAWRRPRLAGARRVGRRAMETTITLTVDGQQRAATVDTRVTLLDLLRERLAVTAPKKGCDHGQCGSCTVLLDGRRVTTCLALAVQHDGAEIITAAGLGTAEDPHPVQQAFLDHDGFQCGYCTPGQICSAVGILAELEAGWRAT